MKEIKIREVKKEDIPLIYEWRNNPEVRKLMFNSSEIFFDEHKKFWNKKLESVQDFAFIVEYEGKDAGVLRLDKKDDKYEVDILMDPKQQGRGIGTLALNELRKFIKEKNLKNVYSKVKPDNIASQKVFEKNNFKAAYIYYEYEGEK